MRRTRFWFGAPAKEDIQEQAFLRTEGISEALWKSLKRLRCILSYPEAPENREILLLTEMRLQDRSGKTVQAMVFINDDHRNCIVSDQAA